MKVYLLATSLLITASALAGTKNGQTATLTMLSRNFEADNTVADISLKRGEHETSLPEGTPESFSVSFSAELDPESPKQTLIDMPGFLQVRKTSDATYGNVIEAGLTLCDSIFSRNKEVREMTVSVPLDMLDSRKRQHTFTLSYNKANLTLYADGRLVDNDFPTGTPTDGPVWAYISSKVNDFSLCSPAREMKRDSNAATDNLQYWTPPYHNAWVGDVVACFFNGRYHLFYLFDRRGHQSKFGKGGHYFEHLSTADLVNWTEHEAATPIEHQWETLGTGTPFEYDGKLCVSYGLHTTRLVERERTTLPLMQEAFDKAGHTVTADYDSIAGVYPAGSTFAVSHDGGNTFSKSHKLFHFCENPSIYSDTDGTLMMLANYGARGTWTSDSLAGGWRCVNADFPPGGDCTFPFSIGEWDYVAGGFNGMWRKPAGAPVTLFEDMVRDGADCYNGLSVPAFTRMPDGRTLMAGWLKMRGWGGALVIHRVVADGPEGDLGSAWVDELMPELPAVKLADDKATETPASFLCEFTATAEKGGEGSVTLKFSDNDYWKLDLSSGKAQFSSRADDEQRTLAEGGDVAGARDYAIKSRTGMKKKIPVRVAVYSRPKFGGSIIDVEIDGRRTMLTYREGLTVDRISVVAEGMRVR